MVVFSKKKCYNVLNNKMRAQMSEKTTAKINPKDSEYICALQKTNNGIIIPIIITSTAYFFAIKTSFLIK